LTKYYLFFVLHTSLIFSQSSLDSLFKSVSGNKDTVKINQLLDYTWINKDKNPKLALVSGKEAVKIARQIKHKKFLAESLNLVGVVNKELAQYDKSLTLYKEALQIAEEIKDSFQIAYSLNNIGNIYRIQGSLALALDYIFKSLNVFEKLNEKTGVALCTENIALIYKRQNNYAKALEYLGRTLALQEKTGDRAGRAKSLNIVAEVYFEKGDFESAMNFYLEVEKEYSALNEKNGLVTVWDGIAGIFYKNKEYEKALSYHRRALNLAFKIKNVQSIFTNYMKLGLIYGRLGKFNDADTCFAKGLEISHKAKDVNMEMNGYNYLTEYCELKKDYQKALYYLKKYNSLNETLSKKENIEQVAEIEAIYKWEKNEKERSLLHKDVELKETQRNYLVFIVILALLAMAIVYKMYLSKKADHVKLTKNNRMKDTLLRIIAHDLKTPFTVIFGYTDVLREDFKNISDEEKLSYIDSIRKASKLSVQLLENLTMWAKSYADKLEFKPANINLNEAVKENFYILDSSAENKNISLISEVPEDIEAFADEEMLKTILRNLITNGIKFTKNGGSVKVSCELLGNEIVIMVEDNGIGMDDITMKSLFDPDEFSSNEGTEGERGSGFGLIVCKEFVTKNGGRIWVESELDKGSKFYFTLPSPI